MRMLEYIFMLKADSHLPNFMFQWKLFENDEKCFLFLFSFLRYLNFCPDFFGQVGKRLEKKAKFHFKIHNVRDWIKNN